MSLKNLMFGALFLAVVGCGGSPVEEGQGVGSVESELAEDDLFCRALPFCDQGENDYQVPSRAECLQDDAVCYETTRCGITITCTGPRPQEPIQCRALPSCNNGDVEVAHESECLQDASCYQATMCGQTIWCTNADA